MIEKERFEEKLKIRLEAHRNLGNTIGYGAVGYDIFADEQMYNLYKQMEENMEQADRLKYLTYHTFILPGKGWRAWIKRFIKRAVRKVHFMLFGWMMMPLIEQQNMFNGKMWNAVTGLRDIVLQQEQRYADRQKQQYKVILKTTAQKANHTEAAQ